MLWMQVEGAVKRFAPVLHSLVGQAEHKVQVDGGKACGARELDSLGNLVWIMDASQLLQERGVIALGPHAQAIDACLADSDKLLLGEGTWIGLQCDFCL